MGRVGAVARFASDHADTDELEALLAEAEREGIAAYHPDVVLLRLARQKGEQWGAIAAVYLAEPRKRKLPEWRCVCKCAGGGTYANGPLVICIGARFRPAQEVAYSKVHRLTRTLHARMGMVWACSALADTGQALVVRRSVLLQVFKAINATETWAENVQKSVQPSVVLSL
jgi:hypothetical protein